MDGPEGDAYAVLIPCLKRSQYRREARILNILSDNLTLYYEKFPSWEIACE